MPWSFSDLILQWISALHLSPSTSVIYASRLSAPFPILRGTEQGCPLSPILLAIEPLAVALREDPNVTGIQYPSIHYKVSLYVDDTLLILTSPLSTLPNFQHLLSSFLGLLGGLIPPKNHCTEYHLSNLDCITATNLFSHWLKTPSPTHLSL